MLLTVAKDRMKGFGVRQFTLLLLSITMVAIGYLGLGGHIADPTLVLAGCLVTVAVLSFSLGRQSTRLGRS